MKESLTFRAKALHREVLKLYVYFNKLATYLNEHDIEHSFVFRKPTPTRIYVYVYVCIYSPDERFGRDVKHGVAN